MWNNRVTALLKTTYPLIQGGMAWVADAQLASAVSNAGGLGIIAAANMPPHLLEQEILKVKDLTDKPYGLNIMLMSSTSHDAIELAAKYRVPVVTTGAGIPGKVIDRLKPLGTTVIPVVASVALAKRVEKQGADGVIAEGTEAGGHIGEITTMVLVPQVTDAINIPVIAAGGIADGRGIAAALALGAEGVQIGTRLVCCKESTVHGSYKDSIIKAKDRSTVVTGKYTGHPVRCLSNKLTSAFEKMERDNVPVEEFEKFGSGRLRAAVVEGDMEWGSIMAGQCSAMVKSIEAASDIITEMFNEAERVMNTLKSNYLDPHVRG
ncbi:MAG: enoyl-[acyl-carrier-protein] reductase FabK [Synergistales bacterium]|nr:enoyl-[acyl-carrier-protein] reductase FabK [Synergistales bacterium]